MTNRITKAQNKHKSPSFAKPMLGEVCLCGTNSDRECSKCEITLCDNCDKGEIIDECSLCPNCKGFVEEGRVYNRNEYYEQLESNFLFVKSNYKKALSNKNINPIQIMAIKKFEALAYSINWNITNACSEIKGMSNQRYGQIKNLLLDEIDSVRGVVSNFA
jgi:hypothetical protein